jgi:hypothetical protein
LTVTSKDFVGKTKVFVSSFSFFSNVHKLIDQHHMPPDLLQVPVLVR